MSVKYNKKRSSQTHFIAKVSILSAISVLLMLFEFALPIAPSFYKIDLSEVAVLIGGFSMGPIAAISIEGYKIILNLILTGTDTALIGEIANFITGISFVLPAILIYQKNKTRKNALIGLITGTITLAIIGAIMNYFVLLPAYSFFYHMPMENLLKAGQILNPNIVDLFSFVCFITIPFNLLKGIIISAIVFVIYKKVSILLK